MLDEVKRCQIFEVGDPGKKPSDKLWLDFRFDFPERVGKLKDQFNVIKVF